MTDSYEWADDDDDDTDFGDNDSKTTFLVLAIIFLVGVLTVGGILFAVMMTAGHQAQLR